MVACLVFAVTVYNRRTGTDVRRFVDNVRLLIAAVRFRGGVQPRWWECTTAAAAVYNLGGGGGGGDDGDGVGGGGWW